MVKFFDIFEKTSTGIGIRVSRQIIPNADYAVYAVYDTSTGVIGLSDYYLWRTITVDTPSTVTNYESTVDLYLNDSCIYPSYGAKVGNYTTISDHLIKLVTGLELEILNSLKTRIDLVRKRLPNPGSVINTDEDIGDGGIVGYAGGFSKKFTVDEYLEFINGALIEINITAPATRFWWQFSPKDVDLNPSPYKSNRGVPASLSDLIVQGGIIRALVAWGLLEVDIAFSSVDSSLAITFDRQSMVQSWMGRLLDEYNKKMTMIKMDFINSYGVAVGTTPYQLLGLWGNMAGMVAQNGPMSVNTILGYGFQASRPM